MTWDEASAVYDNLKAQGADPWIAVSLTAAGGYKVLIVRDDGTLEVYAHPSFCAPRTP